MKVRGLSLIGYVGSSKSGGIQVVHAAHINLHDGTRRTFAFDGLLPKDATIKQIAAAFGRAAEKSLLKALKNS